MSQHRVVIVCVGFGGLQAALKLRRAGVEIALVDRRNFHLFQPLSDQVATGALSPGEVAYPVRAVFKRDRNVRVLLAEVDRFDLERREVVLRSVAGLPAPEPVPYDTLIVAGGSHYSYFGHDEWSAHAAEVKSLESALTVRSRILAAFEGAELARDPGRRGEWLTFAVVGAGPTGVEMAGQIAELARDTLRSDFRIADPGKGNLATIGRTAAVADIKGFKLSGFLAWMTWLVVHLFYLVGFQNRLLVLIRWSISFATRGRGARLITDPADAEAPRRTAGHPEPGREPVRVPVPGANAGDALRDPFRYAP